MKSFQTFRTIIESSRSAIELDPMSPEEFHKEWLNGKGGDQYFYHVTLRRNIKAVLRFGLIPRHGGTMADGFYRDYSNGKIFFSERGGVPYWISAVERHLEHKLDDKIPKLAIVRFPKGLVKDYQEDKLGTRDSLHKSYYTTKPIKAGHAPTQNYRSSETSEI